VESYGLKKEECLMVGDNLQTDIEFANNAEVDSLLTMTGVTSWQEAESGPKATYYCEHL
jgi:4-nitrophenyl phosphatase